ncbi:hypothetical protein ACFQ51_50765 [Streptomyces kaempferi]
MRGVTSSVAERADGLRTLVIGSREAERDRLADLLRQEAAQGPVHGIVSLLALDERPWADECALPTGLVLMTTLIQALGDAAFDAPLWCATSGAVSVHRNDTLNRPLQAMAWGLGRIASMEYPQRWGGLIDLPETMDERAGRRLAAALSGLLDEDHIALRPSGLFARRLVRAGDGPARPDRPGRPAAPSWSPEAPAASAATSPTGWPAAARNTWYWSADTAPKPPEPPNSSPNSPSWAPRRVSSPATSPTVTPSADWSTTCPAAAR